MSNRTIADWLTDYARYLGTTRHSLYRMRAYRQAAATLLSLDRPAEQILAESGRKGLEELPGVGPHLSFTIAELIRTGEFRTFDERIPA
jgi:DNA polymerase/3'-5' exonuclease PolX